MALTLPRWIALAVIGFAIAAVFCTLVEFLESCERGHNFRFIGRSGPPLQPNEYSERQAAGYFKDFLRTRRPFNALVPVALVDSFYSDVRCGLVHEARTKGGWVISTKASRVTRMVPPLQPPWRSRSRQAV